MLGGIPQASAYLGLVGVLHPLFSVVAFCFNATPFLYSCAARVVRHSALQFLAQVVPMCVIGAFEHELVLAES